MKDRKKTALAVLLLVLGVICIILSFASAGGEAETGEITLEEYKEKLEGELEDACSAVKGAGRCQVVVSFERGAENTYKGSNLVETKPPAVLGVTVICEGAASDAVRADLTEMLSALFGIGKNRIAILEAK